MNKPNLWKDNQQYGSQMVYSYNANSDYIYDKYMSCKRLQHLIYKCFDENPFAFNFPQLMPFVAKQVHETNHDSKQCLNHAKSINTKFKPNRLYDTVYNDSEYRKNLLPLVTRSNSQTISPGSKLKFTDEIESRQLYNYTNKLLEQEQLKSNRFASYEDLRGQKHKIYLPFLLSRCQYFCQLHLSCFTSDGIKAKSRLNFNPTRIAELFVRSKVLTETNNWSYADREQYIDHFITAEALESVMLFCNCAQGICFSGELREYVAACIYLQTDYGLLYLMQCGRLSYSNWLETTISIANNFGIEHPVFEFLIFYGSCNLYPISPYHLFSIITSPINSCHYLCKYFWHRPNGYEQTNCCFVFRCKDNTVDSAQTLEGFVWLQKLDNQCCRRTCSSANQVQGLYYNSGLQAVLQNFVNLARLFAVRYEHKKCIICKSKKHHRTKVESELTWANLRCCRRFVHRLCFHEMFQKLDEWYCKCGCIHIGGSYFAYEPQGYINNKCYTTLRPSYVCSFSHGLQTNFRHRILFSTNHVPDVNRYLLN